MQDQTLSFVIKVVAVAITLVLSARWMGGELVALWLQVFELMAMVGR
jgi:type III secretion protein S